MRHTGWKRFGVSLNCAISVMVAAPAFGAEPSRAVVLRATGLPDHDPVLVDALAGEVAAAGYTVTDFDLDGVCDAKELDPERFDLLVVSDGGALPLRSIAPIKRFLRAGGDLIALKTPLWQQSMIRIDGAWKSLPDHRRDRASAPPQRTLFGFALDDVAGWQRSVYPTDRRATYRTVPDGPAPGMRALHVVVDDLAGWDTFGPRKLQNGFAPGHTLTVFSAKGGPRTQQLSIEWTEQDGSRWIAVVALDEEWKQYVLAPEDFRYWQSNAKRGHASDRFNPARAAGLAIGLAFSHTGPVGGRHEYRVGPFGTATADSEFAELVGAFSVPALDTLAPGYKFFECHDVARLERVAGWPAEYPKSLPLAEHIRAPHPRPRGAGFDKGRAWRYIPLIEAESVDGQWRGAPATMLVHADGPFNTDFRRAVSVIRV